MVVAVLLLVVFISWLLNRATERSVSCVREIQCSACRKRDTSETAQPSTFGFDDSQFERMAELYRFAEFGRLSSGLFHDLVNPLAAVSLNIERARCERMIGAEFPAAAYLDHAFTATRRMERFLIAIKKQIAKDVACSRFSLADEAGQVIDMLSYKATAARVMIELRAPRDVSFVGDAVRWSQVIMNLTTNGIDAYDDIDEASGRPRRVVVALAHTPAGCVCTVADWGSGIAPDHLSRVFDPFFTTKSCSGAAGTGIGLSIAKRIIEKDFKGRITVTSEPMTGTVFSIFLPMISVESADEAASFEPRRI